MQFEKKKEVIPLDGQCILRAVAGFMPALQPPRPRQCEDNFIVFGGGEGLARRVHTAVIHGDFKGTREVSEPQGIQRDMPTLQAEEVAAVDTERKILPLLPKRRCDNCGQGQRLCLPEVSERRSFFKAGLSVVRGAIRDGGDREAVS